MVDFTNDDGRIDVAEGAKALYGETSALDEAPRGINEGVTGLKDPEPNSITSQMAAKEARQQDPAAQQYQNADPNFNADTYMNELQFSDESREAFTNLVPKGREQEAMEAIKAYHEQSMQARVAENQGGYETLEREYGPELPARSASVQELLDRYDPGREFRSYLDNNHMGNNPALFRLLDRIAMDRRQ